MGQHGDRSHSCGDFSGRRNTGAPSGELISGPGSMRRARGKKRRPEKGGGRSLRVGGKREEKKGLPTAPEDAPKTRWTCGAISALFFSSPTLSASRCFCFFAHTNSSRGGPAPNERVGSAPRRPQPKAQRDQPVRCTSTALSCTWGISCQMSQSKDYNFSKRAQSWRKWYSTGWYLTFVLCLDNV